MASESGYSNQKKLGTSQFKTIHSVGSDKYGQSVASKALYEKTAVAVITVTEVVGTSGQVEFLNVQYAAHLALPLDVIRITSGNFLNSEFDIISIVDSTNFRILPILKASDITGANAVIMSWVTNKANSDGSQIVAIAPAPIQFVKDTLPVNVSKDTAVPANSVPLPTENLIAQASLSSIDGKFTTLNAKDFATSAKQDTGNSSLSSIDGKFTTLNAKDFATSAKQDTGNSSLSSIDGKFTTLNAKDFATSAKQDTGNTSLSSIDGKFTTLNAKDFATAAKQDTGNTSLSGIGTNTVNIPNVIATEGGPQPTHGVAVMGHTGAGISRHILVENNGRQVTHVTNSVLPTGASTLAEQQTQTTAIGSLTETAPATDTASSGLNGRLQRIAQRLTSLIALFPTSIGTKASAASLSVVLASDQAAINVTTETSSGTITQVQKSVGITAVRATVSGSAPSATRKKLMLKPSKNNTGSIYFGDSTVTTATGMEIIGPDRLEFALDASDYYLISDTAGQVVEIVEIS